MVSSQVSTDSYDSMSKTAAASTNIFCTNGHIICTDPKCWRDAGWHIDL